MRLEDRCELERLIDTHKLQGVLEALVQICEEKASHINDSWQDITTARVWNKAASELDVSVTRIVKLDI